jgi:hypothetical protein
MRYFPTAVGLEPNIGLWACDAFAGKRETQ